MWVVVLCNIKVPVSGLDLSFIVLSLAGCTWIRRFLLVRNAIPCIFVFSFLSKDFSLILFLPAFV